MPTSAGINLVRNLQAYVDPTLLLEPLIQEDYRRHNDNDRPGNKQNENSEQNERDHPEELGKSREHLSPNDFAHLRGGMCDLI